jgi:acetolactate synthase-1/2/3 large subunit
VSIGRSYDLAGALQADAQLGLTALVEEVGRLGAGGIGDRWDPARIEQGRATHMQAVSGLFASDEYPIRPERLMAELLHALPARSVILADPGTPCPYVSAYWRMPEPGRFFISPRAFGALGYSLPGVVGAHFARPDAGRIVGMMGDGSFGISVGELETIRRLDLPVTLVVCNNASYGWIKAGQKSRGADYFSVDFDRSDHAAIASAFGLHARRVEAPGELGEAMREALHHPGPCLLDVVTQPLEEANAPVSKWIA